MHVCTICREYLYFYVAFAFASMKKRVRLEEIPKRSKRIRALQIFYKCNQNYMKIFQIEVKINGKKLTQNNKYDIYACVSFKKKDEGRIIYMRLSCHYITSLISTLHSNQPHKSEKYEESIHITYLTSNVSDESRIHFIYL